MAIEKSVSNDFLSTFFDSINIFDCSLPGVINILKCLKIEIFLARKLSDVV